MINFLRKLFLRPPALSNSWKITVIIIGVVGLLDSSYLTYSHYKNLPIACPLRETVNTCQVVATSAYSTMLGVPLSLIGLIFYATVILIGLVSLKEKYQFVLNFIIPLAFFSWLFAVRLTYLQFFVIGSVCYYCLLSACLTTILMIMGIIMIKKIDF